LYPALASIEDSLIDRIVQEGWESVADTAPVAISPTSDDRPSVGQMGLWRNFTWEKPSMRLGLGINGFPYSQVIIVIILLVVAVLVLPLNLLPFLVRGPTLTVTSWAYFFLIGMAFMAIEVVLIQQFALLVGPSAYSIATVLLTLLIGSGVGSRLSTKISTITAFAGIGIWLLLDVFFFAAMAERFGALPMALRMLVAAVMVFPLGLFMGMPFPKGVRIVGSLVDWGFAVNGAASVFGGTLALLVAFTWGFRVTLLAAGIVYLVAYLLIRFCPQWTRLRCSPDVSRTLAGAE